MLSIITIETPKKGDRTRITCKNALPSAIRICSEEYNNKRGMCVTRNLPIPNKVEFIFDETLNEIQQITNLNFEGEHRTMPHEISNKQIRIIS